MRHFFLATLFAALAAALATSIGCGDVNAALEKVTQARGVAADLLVQFATGSDAANRSVMADTDEASVAFAKEASQATAAVQKDVETLRPLLQSLGFSEESTLLDQFSTRFAEYRMLDQRILDLAVENTNLKAQRIAFGPALEAADAFRDAMNAVAAAATGPDAWRVKALAASAVTTVREIEVLQAPHIANADDEVMTRMEKAMSASETEARKALTELRPLAAAGSRAKLDAASAALKTFMDLNAQITALSRKNTNVRSLALSLDQKRKITVACEDSLRALHDALAKRGYSGIRER